jgi:hypothetical protein
MSVVRARSITDVLHFTTNRGVVGILSKGEILSRRQLPEQAFLEYVYQPNVDQRKDPAWTDYVSLSISRINDWMFAASTRWHIKDGVSWVVISLKPEILAHPGVVFTTTNNIYPARLHGSGTAGLEQMFAQQVVGRYAEVHDRPAAYPESWTTDRQAEVLYPGKISTAYVQRIDVQTAECQDDIAGMLGALDIELDVHHQPQVFD